LILLALPALFALKNINSVNALQIKAKDGLPTGLSTAFVDGWDVRPVADPGAVD